MLIAMHHGPAIALILALHCHAQPEHVPPPPEYRVMVVGTTGPVAIRAGVCALYVGLVQPGIAGRRHGCCRLPGLQPCRHLVLGNVDMEAACLDIEFDHVAVLDHGQRSAIRGANW